MKNKLRKIVIVTACSLLAIGISIVLFFLFTKAPILEGSVIYSIPYNEEQHLDIYKPTNEVYEKSPVLLFIHGGGWIVGRKESINMNRFNGSINTLREKGYTVISIEYTLGKEGTPFPDCIIDVFQAIKWINENAVEYNLDINNLGLLGESAGGHLAMISAFASPKDYDIDQPDFPISYVIDVYGPVDLNKLRTAQAIDSAKVLLKRLPSYLQEPLDLEKRLFGFDPDEDSIRTKMFTDHYSPVSYIKNQIPPVLIIHGDEDILVPLAQSLELESLLKQENAEYEMQILDEVNHAFIGASTEQMNQVQERIADFVLDHYKTK